MSGSHVVQTEGLGKKFGSFIALQGVSIRYEGTRAVGYLGPNGAGKTTTLKLLTGLLRPSAGSASIDGNPVTGSPKVLLRDVGALIETPEPYPQLTGWEALQMAGEFRGLRGPALKARVEELDTRLGLPPLDRKCGKLSKGQRQRVVFAGTILTDPGVLILDEPTSGLDPAERYRIRAMILELKKDHLILMSSHLLAEVTETCDDVIFVNHGSVLLQDTVRGIAERSRSRAVDVEFGRPTPAPALEALRGLADSWEPLSDRRYRVRFDGADEKRSEILSRLVGIAPVLSYASVGSALEATYMEIMKETTGLETPGMVPPPPPPPTPSPS